MSELHLLRPFWLLALLPLMLLVWRMSRPAYARSNWKQLCDPHLFPHILHQPEENHNHWAPWLAALPGILLILAMAGPVWQQRPHPIVYTQSALIIILDLSHSMEATDIKPNRLTRAKHKIMDILRLRQEGQTALLVYAKTPFVVTPLTHDTATISAQLASLDTALMPAQGSHADLAIEKAMLLFHQAEISHGYVLLITDEWLGEQQVVAQLVEAGHTFSILGVGSQQGAAIPLVEGGFLKDHQGQIVIARLDQEPLQKLANRGGGRYQTLTANDQDILTLLAVQEDNNLTQHTQNSDIMTDLWHEEGPWIVLFILPIAALAMRKGILFVVLWMLAMPGLAQAMNWDNLWLRRDQQAMQQLKAGKILHATALFEHRQWRAIAHYRAGQYQQTINLLQGDHSVIALYNKGNALAKLGHWQAAANSYTELLKQQPDHADALYNLAQLHAVIELSAQTMAMGGHDRLGNQGSRNGRTSSNHSRLGQKSSSHNKTPIRHKTGTPLEMEHNQQGDGETIERHDPNSKKARRTKQQQNHSENDPATQEKDTPEEDQKQQIRYNESRLATQQWLRRVPDDPGGLLRRKFRYQYQRQLHESPDMTTLEEHPW